MTKFFSAFLLLATVVADAADDLLSLMNAKQKEFTDLLAGEEAEIKPDNISPLFADAENELKTAAELDPTDAAAIKYQAMADILKLVKADADTNITDPNVDALIDTVMSGDPATPTIVSDITAFLKSVAPAAATPVAGNEPAGGEENKEETKEETTVAPDTADATTVAADAEEGEEGDEEEEEDEEDGADEQSASFNFALSSALLSIVV
jgi:ribosomal protein L12E/L44/L45/RPP1/RPP2